MDYSEEIREKEKELAILKEKQNKHSELPEAYKLAEVLHSKLCHWNHIDGCGWDYENWDNVKGGDSGSRGRYLEKSINIINKVGYETALKVIKEL